MMMQQRLRATSSVILIYDVPRLRNPRNQNVYDETLSSYASSLMRSDDFGVSGLSDESALLIAMVHLPRPVSEMRPN